MQFQGFKPEAMNRIAKTLGYESNMGSFQDFLNNNPDKKQRMEGFNKKAVTMMRGGYVKGYAEGGDARKVAYGSPSTTGMSEEDYSSLLNQGYTMYGDEGAFNNYLSSNNLNKEGVMASAMSAAASGQKSNNIMGGGLDNFGPGQVDPRMRPPPGLSPGVMTTGNEGIVRSDYVDPRTSTSDMRDRSFQPNPREPVHVPQASSVSIGQEMINQAYNPSLPYGGSVGAVGTVAGADTIIDPRQNLDQINVNTTMRDTAQGATTPTAYDTSTTSATQGDGLAGDAAKQASDEVQGRTGAITAGSTVNAAKDETTLVDSVTAAQGTAVKVDAPMQREIQAGEIISGSADAEKAAKFTEQVQAAEATPSKKATVAGQLESLMTSFDDGATPAWAAGAMRAAQERMLARGMGASSMSGQAIVQAAMESALPIAQMDASTQATFEQANLSNRQQRAMQMAEQRAKFVGMEFDQDFQSRVQNSARIGDIANMNFTAEQQIALENSRAANTMELNNLSNRQGKVMAQAGALANLEQANLSNQQQSAVQNAQNFLAMDMQNMNNLQQSDVFRAQQRQQALFSDAAAINASKQFNATSENQTKQFTKNMQTQVEQFNASQVNAMDSQNQEESNAMEKFTQNMMNQRDQFTAANQLVVDQNNAVWRREIATADTAAINRANELNAAATLDMSNTAFNNLWNYYGDTMEWAWTSAENQQERWNKLAQQQMINDTSITVASLKNDYQSSIGFGSMIGKFLTAGMFGL